MFVILERHAEAPVLARAIDRWGRAVDRTRIEQLATDNREPVGKAAAAALARRSTAPAGETTRAR